MKTIRLFLFFLAIAPGVYAQNTDPLSYHNSHQLTDTSYSIVKANGDSTIFLFEGANSSGSNYRTMSVNADSTQVIWQGGSQPSDTLEIWGAGLTSDSATTGSAGGNYHLPYNGNSTDYLGGDTTYHALPSIYKKTGTDSLFQVIGTSIQFISRVIDTSASYHWKGSNWFDNVFTQIGRIGSQSGLALVGSSGNDPNWRTFWQKTSSGDDIDFGLYTPNTVLHFGNGFYPNTGSGYLVMSFGKNSKSYLDGSNLGYNQGTIKIGGDGVTYAAGATLDVFNYPNHRALPPFRFNYSNSDVLKDTLVSGAIEPYKDSLYFTGQNLIRKRLAFANEPATPTITSGTSAPASTPGKVGDIYVDITNKKLYFAAGNSSSADWIIAN